MDAGRSARTASEAEGTFDGLPVTASRCAVWARLVAAVARRGLGRALVAMAVPEGPPVVVGDAAGDLPDRDLVEACLADRRPRASASAELLPLVERGTAVAVLRVEAAAGAEAALARLAAETGAFLTERAWALEAKLTAELSTRLVAVEDLASGAAAALATIVPALGASGGAMFETRAAALVLVADHGAGARERRAAVGDGIPFPHGLAWQAVETGAPRVTHAYGAHEARLPGMPVDPILVVMPLEWRGATRSVMVLSYAPTRLPSPGDLAILRSACDVLASHLDALREAYAQDRLLALLDSILDGPVDAIYASALRVAVECVPGAQTGSILVRDAEGDGFAYRAAVGFELEALRGVRSDEASLRAWYAPETGAWGRGRPRVARASDGLVRLSRATRLGRELGEAGRVASLKANLCLPILVDDEVRAVVNLDSLAREDAFGRDSLRIARQVVLLLAALLRIALRHESVRAASVTDPVTGLLNRRGAEAELGRALARARRDGAPLSVLVMDLGGFKRVNDTHGHATGDEALRRVADALARRTRAGDVLARWGGDEFVAILPRQAAADAGRTTARLVRAVSALRIGTRPLALHVGAASFPDEAAGAAELLALADARMYARKRDEDGAEVA